ncbi:cation transporter [Treponema parvum]|uniref:Cation transporter n=1 Tax=Treponema parvum TaxID=138851 RepID=A0A975F534_9SPIR|nr:cation diffusion facilitator family transporter [Treponema parvum]QTQ14586.1 cation transporter [Treponema parvum]
MFGILVRIFIANPENTSDFAVREKYGILCGALGLFFNLLLFILKLVVGIVTRSVAVTGDAFNHLSDSAASLLTIIGFKFSSKKPDKNHPFGHGRLEYVMGLAIAFFIITVSLELMKSSVLSLFSPKIINAGLWTCAVLVFSILIKTYMYAYNRFTAKKIDSAAMSAAAKDSLSDTLTTFVVLLSILVNRYFDFPMIDGIAGMIVAVFIFLNGIEAVRDVVTPLLGTIPQKQLVRDIERTALKFPLIKGVHDIVVHEYGPGRMIVTLHVEVPGEESVFKVHEAIDRAEKAIQEELNCIVLIHADPIDFNSEKNLKVRKLLPKIASGLNAGITVHEARCIVENKKTKVVFEVTKPFECKLSDNEIRSYITAAMKKEFPECECKMTIEHPFT